MFPFNPYFGSRRRVNRVDSFGIPVLRTIYVTTDTTNNQIVYGLCPYIWRQLPNEGLLLLNIVHTPATTAGDDVPVFLATTLTQGNVNNADTVTSTSAKQLINGSGDPMVNNEITTGNRYFIYYNKCTGTFQTVNHIVIPTTATA